MKVIVAQTIERGRDRARREGLMPREVKIISTSGDGRAARGFRLDREDVIWDDGWWAGSHAEEVGLALRMCFKVQP